jgi:thioesterase domain-containing protein
LSAQAGPTRTEAVVAQAWGMVVGAASFRAGMTWEEAGGDSLDALHFWCLIEEALGASLTTKTIGADFTPAAVIAEIEKQVGRRDQTGTISRAPTVFFLPSADGDTPIQTQFRAAFHNQIRFEVVEYPDWPDMTSAPDQLDVIINSAVSQIIASEVQEILLAGYSFGGFVACEVARRLDQLGRQVDFVGLIDSRLDLLSGPPDPRARVTGLLHKVLFDPASLEVTLIKFLARHSAFSALRCLGRATRWLTPKRGFKLKHQLNYHLRVHALQGWNRRPVEAPVFLFHTDEFAPKLAESTWRAVAKHLQLVPVGGSHFSILLPPERERLCRQFLKIVNAARLQRLTSVVPQQLH